MLNKWGIKYNWPSTKEELSIRLKSLIDSNTYSILNVDRWLDKLLNWSDYSRGYHGFNHLTDLLIRLDRTSPHYDKLVLLALTHDIVYDTLLPHGESEKLSAIVTKVWCEELGIEDLSEIVEWTADYNIERDNELFNLFKEYDLSILDTLDITDFIEYEKGVRWEWRWVPYSQYKEKRIEILSKLLTIRNNPLKETFIAFIAKYKPSVAVFAGSFNPFHKGHEWILHKAEFGFDECILLQGINPDKQTSNSVFNIRSRWCKQYGDLLVDEVDRLKVEGINMTLIRGLRNGQDLEYEKSFWKWNEEIGLDIDTYWLITPPELNHISSSAIRGISKFCETEVWTNYI
jgi:pantetheine-phosphate adenylyltransferase